MKTNLINVDEIKVGDIAPTKFALELLTESVLEQVNQGTLNPLDLAVKMNALETMSKMIKDNIIDIVIDELHKYPKGKADVLGASIQRSDYTKYDYSHIAEWQQIEEQIQLLKARQKELEDYEKEYYKGNLPIKSSTTSYKITLKK